MAPTRWLERRDALTWRHYLFGFSGRINRAPYWLAIPVALGFVLVGVAIAIPYIAIEHPTTADRSHGISALGIATIAAEGLLVVAYFVFAIAIAVKRLHDRNRSAWWLIPFAIMPQAIQVLADPRVGQKVHMPEVAVLILSLISLGLSLWAFVELGCLRGTVGENRYGPDPLAGRI